MVFGKKKKPILTTPFCDEMMRLQQAVEVLTGQTVRFACLDFNRRRGAMYVGGDEKVFIYDHPRSDLYIFSLEPSIDQYRAYVDDNGEMSVICDEKPHMHGKHAMWWVGRSSSERREKPADPELEKTAELMGITLGEYLDL
jgi:hypothetical protein